MLGAAALAVGRGGVIRGQSTPSTAIINVAATFSILGDWVQQVGGEHISLSTIVPAGGDSHRFDPNPNQVASITGADLIFEIGIGFESWLDDMVQASGTSAQRIAVSDGITLLAVSDGENEHEDHSEDDGHDHGDHDPHIWGDVAKAIDATGVIRDALSAAAPDHAAAFEANAAAYIEALTGLDATIRDQVATLPEDRRKLVTTHDTFAYYAHAYGFEIVGTALGSLSTEGGDPSARDISALVGQIVDSGVPAIFAENVSSTDLMETIADEAGVELAPPLYTDALGEPGTDGDTYVGMMTWNTNTIVTALGQE